MAEICFPCRFNTDGRSLIIPADLHGEYAVIIFYRGVHGVVQEENVHIVALPVYSLDKAKRNGHKGWGDISHRLRPESTPRMRIKSGPIGKNGDKYPTRQT